MTTVSNKEDLKNALAELDIPNIVKRTIYRDVVLGRTYSPRNPTNAIDIPGAGVIHVTGELYKTYKTAGMERARHYAHRTALVRASEKNIRRNRERYSVSVSDYARMVLRATDAIEGTVVAIDRGTAAELVDNSIRHERDLLRREEQQRINREEKEASRRRDAVHDTGGDTGPAPTETERRREKIYATGATYLLAKTQNMERPKVA
jgi:hypothetical protein